MLKANGETDMPAFPPERISIDKNILGGKPAISGTRISVEMVLGLLSDGWTDASILEAYPHITRDDILACIAFARDLVVEDFEITSAA